jgi:hypothetical protein
VTARVGETYTTHDVSAPVAAVLIPAKGTTVRDAVTGCELTLPEYVTVRATQRRMFGTLLFLHGGHPHEADPVVATAEQMGNRLAFGAKDPLRIRRWLRSGELDRSCQTVQDLYDQAGAMLDRACSGDICGPCVFQGEDGAWYVGTVEFHIGPANPAYVQELLEEDAAEGIAD